MSKIEKLTPKQELLKEQFKTECLIKYGLSTERMDKEVATEVMTDFYRRMGEDTPEFVYCDSPLQAQIKINMVKYNLTEKDLRKKNVKLEFFNTWQWGQMDMPWICFYTFVDRFVRSIHSDADRKLLRLWERLAQSCGWVYTFKNMCFICDRPTIIKKDDRTRLHCEDGPAVAFMDGYSVYYYHGVSVPKDIILDRKSITINRIFKESNTEVRRVMIELYGRGNFITDSGAELVNEDETGKLWRKKFVDDEDMLIAEFYNSTPEPDGTHKTYFHHIHPEVRLMYPDGTFGPAQPLTARSAIASTFGKTAEEYHPFIET
jgi:hypothetical protein